ncbi:hypothetical protein H8356DRAFT_934674, partial [Neocallimastix lanati (nom. inval.)]
IHTVLYHSHFLVIKNLPFVVVDTSEYMFSIGKMTQRIDHVPIYDIEEFFPIDYRKDQGIPGNVSVVNQTIEEQMQSQLVAEEADEHRILDEGVSI